MDNKLVNKSKKEMGWRIEIPQNSLKYEIIKNGKVIGFLLGDTIRNKNEPIALNLTHIWIKPKYRGKGICGKILNNLDNKYTLTINDPNTAMIKCLLKNNLARFVSKHIIHTNMQLQGYYGELFGYGKDAFMSTNLIYLKNNEIPFSLLLLNENQVYMIRSDLYNATHYEELQGYESDLQIIKDEIENNKGLKTLLVGGGYVPIKDENIPLNTISIETESVFTEYKDLVGKNLIVLSGRHSSGRSTMLNLIKSGMKSANNLTKFLIKDDIKKEETIDSINSIINSKEYNGGCFVVDEEDLDFLDKFKDKINIHIFPLSNQFVDNPTESYQYKKDPNLKEVMNTGEAGKEFFNVLMNHL